MLVSRARRSGSRHRRRLSAGRVRSLLRCSLVVVCLAVPLETFADRWPAPPRGIAPETSFAETAVQRWDEDDGLPTLALNGVVQTADGYLWLSSFEGLIRFDGLEFTVFDKATMPAITDGPPIELATNGFHALAEGPDGSLWIGTQGRGVLRYRDGRLHRVAGDRFQATVRAILPLSADQAWLGASDAGAFLYRDGELAAAEHAELRGVTVRDIEVDREGTLWFATEGRGVIGLRSGVLTSLDIADGLVSNATTSLAPDGDGLWIGALGGLSRLDVDGQVETLARFDGINIQQLLADDHGSLWLATNQGLFRRRPGDGAVEQLERIDGGESGGGRAVSLDREGHVWYLSTVAGLVQLRASPFRNRIIDLGEAGRRHRVDSMLELEHRFLLGTEHGVILAVEGDAVSPFEMPGRLPDVRVRDLHRDRDGTLWAASHAGLLRLDDGRLFTTADGLPSDQVRIVHRTRGGELWAGTRNGGVFRLEADRVVEVVDARAGLASNFVFSIDEDAGGHLLVGTRGGLNRIDGERRIEIWRTGRELPGTIVFSTLVEKEVVWICTNGGLAWWRGGEIGRLTAEHGLPDEVLFDIARGPDGGLWLAAGRGVLGLDPEQLAELMEGRRTALDVRLLDDRDGMVSRRPTDAAKIVAARDGTLWFPTIEGAAVFDSRRLPHNPVPPAVVIEQMIADWQQVDLRGPVLLPPGTRRINLRFAAPSLRRPRDVQVRYRLEGFEESWTDAGHERQAVYTNLQAGRYRFQVIAANSDGVWNRAGAALDFEVQPLLYQRTGFQLVAAALLLFSGYGLFAWRVRAVRQKNRELERVVEIQRRAETSLRETAEREKAASSRLRDLDRLKDDLLATTSHELRTPIFGMIGLAETLLDDPARPLPPDIRTDLEMIVYSGRQLTGLVNDILDFSKVERGRLQLSRQVVELHSLADIVTTLCKPLLGNKSVELENAVDDDLPMAWADPSRVQQVLQNLVANAVEFTARGTVRLTAEARAGELVVHVADTGIGIAPEHREKVFDSFSQVESATIRQHGGAGLGLAICRQLVELHGGEIWFDSEPGQGTTFSFSLPQADRDAAEAAFEMPESLVPAPAPAPANAAPAPVPGEKGDPGLPAVLIVDDDPVMRRVLTSHLAAAGYRLHVAAGGAEALALLDGQPVDLVLLDVMMPRVSGYEVCRTIRKRHSREDLPVLLVSAKNQDADRIAGFNEGANDYIVKPISRGELLARVGAQLELLAGRRRQLEDLETLSGLLPICAECKKVRDDQGYWNQVEDYISEHSGARFSHGLCPGCSLSFIEEFESSELS